MRLRDSENNREQLVKSLESTVLKKIEVLIHDAAEESNQKLKELMANFPAEPSYPQNDTEKELENSETKKISMLQAIDDGNYNLAFEIALTASDLQLVMMLCKQVDPVQLFEREENTLPQPIILSLIQQLSSDLATDTETKTKYLEESIMALDIKNDVTREHMPIVLDSLCEHLSITLDALACQEQDKSTQKQFKSIKMLHMAASSLKRT
jgi:enhancer of mRNA-decapping protein 4